MWPDAGRQPRLHLAACIYAEPRRVGVAERAKWPDAGRRAWLWTWRPAYLPSHVVQPVRVARQCAGWAGVGRLVNVVSWVVPVEPVCQLCAGVGQGWVSIGEYRAVVVRLTFAATWCSGTRWHAGRGMPMGRYGSAVGWRGCVGLVARCWPPTPSADLATCIYAEPRSLVGLGLCVCSRCAWTSVGWSGRVVQ